MKHFEYVITACLQKGALLMWFLTGVLTAGAERPGVSERLQSFWGSLRRSNGRLWKTDHLCCLLSLVFEEQDDDMMEAAKALLSIFFHHR